MPTIITHGLVGIGGALIYTSYEKKPSKKFLDVKTPKPLGQRPLFWILSFLLPMVPDLDAIGLYLGIPYGHLLGHRGFSHSIFFALLLGSFTALLYLGIKRKTLSIVLFFSLIILSHGILDGFTNGGLGIAYFSPFDPTRYFFPFRPIEVAPLDLKIFFSYRGWQVLMSEAFWIWLPSILFILLFRKYKKKG
ncbi:MAG: metal-dependent hydrolase [Planctomycetota bacterium]|nr:MAG: metal-dependent hydrolase [Planctomycetota bacterium]